MVVVCFDLGGTTVKSAVIDKQDILSKKSCPTPANLEGLLAWMKEIISQQETVAAIALSVPGSVNQETGVIEGISAIPYIHGISWYELLADYQIPVFLENDANCVGLSQLVHQPDLQDFCCVVIGTGIGGAVIVNQRLVRGYKGYGGEFGYTMIEGIHSPLTNWSQFASTGNMVNRVRKAKGDNGWDGLTVFEAAEQGDMICQQALADMYRNLAIGLINIFYTLGPEEIFIGGAISRNETFLTGVRQALEGFKADNPDLPEIPRISACHFQGDANLMGAYVLTTQS